MGKMTFDFSGVSDSAVIEPGKYQAKVVKITKEQKDGGDYPYLKWDLLIMTGKPKGLHINHITTLKPEGLFSLRNTLIACGLSVPKSSVSLDPDKLVGKALGIEVVMRKAKDSDNEYPNVKNVMTVAELSGKKVDDDELSIDGEDDLPFKSSGSATELTEDDL